MPSECPFRELRSVGVAAFIAAAGAAALAQTTTVVVRDPYYRPSAAECSARAERAAMNTVGVAGGAVGGAVGGAAFGAIVNGGRGARTGAVAGAVVGGTAGGVRRNDVYRRVYDDCMRGY